MKDARVDDMLLEMIQPKLKEIEEKFSKGENLDQQDLNTLLLKSQYNHINHLDDKMNEVTASVVGLEGKFEKLSADFRTHKVDIEGKFEVLKTQFASLEDKVAFEIKALKAEFKANSAELKAHNAKLEVTVKETINFNMRWSIGMITLLVVALKLIDMLLR